MENNNNSKQVVLSIVGIAILVIAVVGVTFAFFTYSRTGEKNNIITTGSITFALEDGEQPAINAKDAFPITDNADIATAPSTDFKVTGSLPAGASPVTYKVFAIEGEEIKDPANPPAQTDAEKETNNRVWDRFEDSEISLGLSVTGDTDTAVNIVEAYKYDGSSNYGSAIGNIKKDDTNDTTHPQGLLLATGTLGAGKEIDHKFTIKMWINNTVTISDTNYSYKYRASDVKKGDSPLKNATAEENDNTKLPYQEDGSATDTREVYSDHYYSIKIMVVASDDPNFKGN